MKLGRRPLVVLAAGLTLVACAPKSDVATGPSVTETTTSTSSSPVTTTSKPRPTIPVAELAASAKQAIIAPDGLKDLGGVAEDEHGETYALTEVCEIRLIAESYEYANYYRFWDVARAGYTVKNIGYAYHKSTAAEVIDELAAALVSCDEWTEIDGTQRVVVRNVPITAPPGLTEFYAFCQDSPAGARRFACVAYLGNGNLVSRLSVARPDYGRQALDALQALLPRAAQALLAAG